MLRSLSRKGLCKYTEPNSSSPINVASYNVESILVIVLGPSGNMFTESSSPDVSSLLMISSLESLLK